MFDDDHITNTVGCFVIIALLAIIVISYMLKVVPSLNQNKAIPDPTPRYVEIGRSKVRRNSADVLVGRGGANPLDKLVDGSWYPLNDRDRVTTDDTGEGLLDIKGCMSIYIFQSSELMAAPCSKEEYRSGNVFCSVAGTSAFNNSCTGKVTIQTKSAEIVLDGTWVSVTYLPDTQLSFIAVAKGAATVWPVDNVEERALAKPVRVAQGEFLFSTPEKNADPVNGLPARQPIPLRKLPTVEGELRLTPWLSSINIKAEQDRAPLQGPSAPYAGHQNYTDSGSSPGGTESAAGGPPPAGRRSDPKQSQDDPRQRILRLLKNKELSSDEIASRLRLTGVSTNKWLKALVKERKVVALQTRPIRYRRRDDLRPRRR